MRKLKDLGDYGEQLVGRYLMDKGYHIFGVNYHSPFGEVDVIALYEQELVFVEVKTRKENSQVTGFEAVGLEKQKKIVKTALHYLQENKLDLQPRFDVAVVVYDEENQFTIDYLEAAFDGNVLK